MTGNRDTHTDTDTDSAALNSMTMEDWGRAMMMRLREMVQETILNAMTTPVPTDDIAAFDRRGRMMGTLARAVRYVLALALRPRSSIPQDEDIMRDQDDPIDPIEAQRIEALLLARLEQVRTGLECRGLDRYPFAAREGEMAGVSAGPA